MKTVDQTRCETCRLPLQEGDEYYRAKRDQSDRVWHKACLDADLVPMSILLRRAPTRRPDWRKPK